MPPRKHAFFALVFLALSIVTSVPFILLLRSDWREMPAEVIAARLDEFRCCTVLAAQHLPAGADTGLPACDVRIKLGEAGTCTVQSCPCASVKWGTCSAENHTYACRTESGCSETRAELRDVACTTCATSHVTLRVGEATITRQEQCGVEDSDACRAQLLAHTPVGSSVPGYARGSGNEEAESWRRSASRWDFSNKTLVASSIFIWILAFLLFCVSVGFARIALREPLARTKRAAGHAWQRVQVSAGRASQYLSSAMPRRCACVYCRPRGGYAQFLWLMVALEALAGVALIIARETLSLPALPDPIDPYVPATFNVVQRDFTSFSCCSTVPEKRCQSWVTPLPSCEEQLSGLGAGLCSESGLCCNADCIHPYWAWCAAPGNLSYACRRYRRGDNCAGCTAQTEYSALQIACGRCAQLAARLSIAGQPLKWHTAICGVDDVLGDACVQRLAVQWPAGERNGFVRRGEGKIQSWRSSAPPFDVQAQRAQQEEQQREAARANPGDREKKLSIGAGVCFSASGSFLVIVFVLHSCCAAMCTRKTCTCTCRREPVSPSPGRDVPPVHASDVAIRA